MLDLTYGAYSGKGKPISVGYPGTFEVSTHVTKAETYISSSVSPFPANPKATAVIGLGNIYFTLYPSPIIGFRNGSPCCCTEQSMLCCSFDMYDNAALGRKLLIDSMPKSRFMVVTTQRRCFLLNFYKFIADCAANIPSIVWAKCRQLQFLLVLLDLCNDCLCLFRIRFSSVGEYIGAHGSW